MGDLTRSMRPLNREGIVVVVSGEWLCVVEIVKFAFLSICCAKNRCVTVRRHSSIPPLPTPDARLRGVCVVYIFKWFWNLLARIRLLLHSC